MKREIIFFCIYPNSEGSSHRSMHNARNQKFVLEGFKKPCNPKAGGQTVHRSFTNHNKLSLWAERRENRKNIFTLSFVQENTCNFSEKHCS